MLRSRFLAIAARESVLRAALAKELKSRQETFAFVFIRPLTIAAPISRKASLFSLKHATFQKPFFFSKKTPPRRVVRSPFCSRSAFLPEPSEFVASAPRDAEADAVQARLRGLGRACLCQRPFRDLDSRLVSDGVSFPQSCEFLSLGNSIVFWNAT